MTSRVRADCDRRLAPARVGSLMRIRATSLVIGFLVMLGGSLFAAVPAEAYCGSCAASWANNYAYSTAPGFPRLNDDCANFVSQSLRLSVQEFRAVQLRRLRLVV